MKVALSYSKIPKHTYKKCHLNLCSLEPCSIDKVLHGPNTKAWQEALEYEIGQLEKLWTWEIVDCPKSELVIPCTEVLKEKRGPTGEIHREVLGTHCCWQT